MAELPKGILLARSAFFISRREVKRGNCRDYAELRGLAREYLQQTIVHLFEGTIFIGTSRTGSLGLKRQKARHLFS